MRHVDCSFSGNDSRGGEAVPVTLIVQLCNCTGERGQCVWDELIDGYYNNDTFQIVACDCNATLYEGQQRRLYTAAYRETRTEAVNNLKWCTDQH